MGILIGYQSEMGAIYRLELLSRGLHNMLRQSLEDRQPCGYKAVHGYEPELCSALFLVLL